MLIPTVKLNINVSHLHNLYAIIMSSYVVSFSKGPVRVLACWRPYMLCEYSSQPRSSFIPGAFSINYSGVYIFVHACVCLFLLQFIYPYNHTPDLALALACELCFL